jgi:hypothetical protein
MVRLLKNKKFRLIGIAIAGFVLFYYVLTSISLFNSGKLGTFNKVKPVRQSVNLGPKIDKIKRIDSTQIEDKTNATNINPGVYNDTFSPDNSKGLGVGGNK